ncbi:PTS mannitol transporter subunit IICB [Stackebrandtia albiflava]|uniref:PTS mannitol transporter subunit IICB n=1 Tax=Stackebrandtia albiflava TaxID=406432 RepID=UPI0011BF3590|nr:PTS mannitol transporter subunit IICB [Stackebrandtia albiflava]
MSSEYTPPVQGTGFKATVQRIGGHLAGMVMPNIGAFIAWGLITALFIPTGWLPNEEFGALVDPMVKVLLPVLIGYTGGRLVHGQRGAVVGAVATMGIVVGADMPMFLGAMLIGPLAAYVLRLFDGLVQDRVRPGFEMLVDNMSAGVIGAGVALLGNWGIGPVMQAIASAAEAGANWMIEHGLLPLVSVVVEPAKVLFLNNAINHGVFTPIGTAQAAETGQSIMFMIESNPGPGLGLLIAFWMFGPRRLRPSVPAAGIIHFLGGIHEIYFPYVLMKPRLILAVIAGGATGVGTFLITGAGLVAAPSPGSIFAYLPVMTPGGWWGTLLGIVLATAASFLVAAALMGFGRVARREEAAEAAAAEAESAQATDHTDDAGAAPARS